MEKSVIQNLLQIILYEFRRHFLAVIAVLVKPVDIPDGEAVHIAHRHDALRCIFGNDFRAGHVADVAVVEGIRHRILRLNPEIKLVDGRLLQLLYDHLKIDGLIDGHAAHHFCGLGEQAEILHHHISHKRPLHLDHNLLPVRQHGCMHLSDGCAAKRFFVYRRKKLLNRSSEFRLDFFFYHIYGKRADIRPQFFQFGAVFRRQNILTAGHNLSNLNKSRSQILQKMSERLRRQAVPDQLVLADYLHYFIKALGLLVHLLGNLP